MHQQSIDYSELLLEPGSKERSDKCESPAEKLQKSDVCKHQPDFSSDGVSGVVDTIKVF